MYEKADRESSLAEMYAEQVLTELGHATKEFGHFDSGHEGCTVISEELHALWEAVRADHRNDAKEKAVKIAALAIQFLVDVGPQESVG